jgi:hypothetical protein
VQRQLPHIQLATLLLLLLLLLQVRQQQRQPALLLQLPGRSGLQS